MGVQGRTAIVTGATSGIGAEIARVLGARGAKVAVGGRDRPRGDAVVAEITEAGGTAAFFPYDAGDITAGTALLAAVEAALGPVDILINNAGTMFFGPFEGHTAETFDTAMAVNLRAPFLLTQAVVGGMAQRRHGRVVFISSNGATSGAAMTTLYAASKAGLEGLMRALVAEYAPFGLTFNTVEPGLVTTPLTETMLADPAMRERMSGFHPNKRVGTVGEIAPATAMLADDDAGHMLSNVVVVDGGLTRTIGYAVVEPPKDKIQ
jgi:NAD(P)-dependent dehydrogenase (short-subunit alcohol dehydrogenase family)